MRARHRLWRVRGDLPASVVHTLPGLLAVRYTLSRVREPHPFPGGYRSTMQCCTTGHLQENYWRCQPWQDHSNTYPDHSIWRGHPASSWNSPPEGVAGRLPVLPRLQASRPPWNPPLAGTESMPGHEDHCLPRQRQHEPTSHWRCSCVHT